MARLSRRYGALAQPLDDLLGAPARVRVLRALDRVPGPLTVAAIAKETGLTHNATQQALTRFTDAGLVDEAASGRHRLYRMNDQHPFSAGLRTLFAVERDRRQALQLATERWADRQSGVLRAVWLFGSVARREDTFGSDLDLAVIADGQDDARRLAHALAEELAPIATQLLVSPSVLSYESAEVLALPETDAAMWANLRRDAITLYGRPPVTLHAELEQRASRHPTFARRVAALRAGHAAS